MNNLETKTDTLPTQNNISETKTDKLDFLNNEQFFDIKEQLTKTIANLEKEHIVPEKEFRANIERITKDIFNDPLFNFDIIAKTNQSEDIFLFRTKFENIKKELDKQENLKLNEQLRNNLETKYSQIDEKYKPQTSDLETLKKNPKIQENISKIPPDKQDLYVSYLYASEKIITESKDKKLSKDNYQFVEGFISLNKELWVESSISLDGFDIIEDEINEPTDKNKKADVTERSMEDIVHNENLWTELAENNSDIGDFVLDSSNDTFENKDIEENSDTTKIIREKLGTRYKEDIQSSVQQLLGKNKLTTYRENSSFYGHVIPDFDRESILLSTQYSKFFI